MLVSLGRDMLARLQDRLAKYSARDLSASASASASLTSSLFSFSIRVVAKASSREKELEAALPGEEQPAGGTVVPGV